MQYQTEALSIQMGADETERRFVWLQPAEAEGACVQIAPLALYERDGDFTEENSRIVMGTVTPIRREQPLSSCKVRIEGLTPGTTYVYRVGSATEYAPEIYQFIMPEEGANKQSFFLVSDLHINIYRRPLNSGDPDGTKALARWENTLTQAEVFDGTPAFCLSVGDNISVANMPASFYPNPDEFSHETAADYAFREHLEVMSAPALKRIPFVSVLGNHDAERHPDGTTLGDINNVLYDMPNDDGYSGHYLDCSSGNFYFKSGDLLVVGINFMVSAADNTAPCAKEIHRAFMERAVAAHPDTRWRILLTHVPAYSYVSHFGKETTAAREVFDRLIDGLDFDIVFTGHQHAFSRTYPIDGEGIFDKDSIERTTDSEGYLVDSFEDVKGTIHYNVPSAYNHAFHQNAPEEAPEAIFPAYGITKNALENMKKDFPQAAECFRGVLYASPMYTHVSIEKGEVASTMTVRSVRSDTNTAIDTLILRKA